MQMNLNLPISVPHDAYDFGSRSSGESHGTVLTKPHIVELILDLAGYTEERDLTQVRLLEPSCGAGAFLLPAARRLLHAANKHHLPPASLANCITAFDIDGGHVTATKMLLKTFLQEQQVDETTACNLVESWVREGDFLLTPLESSFDVVVGNPPYIRIEQLSAFLHTEYRRLYSSLYDRADLYVAFIERGLSVLSPEGVLAFICADRWITNKYGAPLRRFISSQYQLRCYIDLHTASPFESDVIAYPSIFVLGRGQTAGVPVITLDKGSPEECASVNAALVARREQTVGLSVVHYDSWFNGEEPWVLSSPKHLSALRELEARFLPIEATAKVGIGVATGNDSLYIVNAGCDIEPDRLVPLVMRDEIAKGQINSLGRYVVNTFAPNGQLIELARYPQLEKYLTLHGEEIKQRHVAKKNPRSWFRTIDRVYPDLVNKPKLLIPDIAGSNEVAFDEGKYHPHHNLYFVVSEQWDMEVLGGLLSSRVALFFVWSYAVKMRGGYLRFQAQYLRRIHLPAPSAVEVKLAEQIKIAFKGRNFAALDRLALQAYGLAELPDFKFVDTRK